MVSNIFLWLHVYTDKQIMHKQQDEVKKARSFFEIGGLTFFGALPEDDIVFRPPARLSTGL